MVLGVCPKEGHQTVPCVSIGPFNPRPCLHVGCAPVDATWEEAPLRAPKEGQRVSGLRLFIWGVVIGWVRQVLRATCGRAFTV